MASAPAPVEFQPGSFAGLSYAEYSRIPAMNFSTLRLYRRTPAHARERLDNPKEPTSEQQLGSTCHLAILEPERLERDFVVAPKIDKRFKKGKAEWAAFQAAHVGKGIIPQDEYDLARGMRDAVWAHPMARDLLAFEGENEFTLAWYDEETGIPCRGRLDRYTHLSNNPCIVDLKSASDASRRSFEKSVYNYGYHQQGAMYLDGANTLSPGTRPYLFIVVESERPHCVAVYELQQDAIDQGRDDYRRFLRTHLECLRTGRYPGYGDGVDYVSLPPYAFKAFTEAE